MNKVLYKDLSTYLKERFGQKVWKVPVNGGFSCPNRDGTKGYEGCIFCNNDSFSSADHGDIENQVRSRIEALKRKKIYAYIIYFQSYSNTYAPVSELKRKIESSLIDDGIVALHIGTRPDTVDAEKLDYFSKINKEIEVVIEYGLQSSNLKTLDFINRKHTAEEFSKAVEMTHLKNIKTCAHIILGLPGETKKDMLETVRFVVSCGVHSIKFHNLHVVKNTRLENIYIQDKIKVLNIEEYAEILAECISYLPENMIISRLVGDAAQDILVAPKHNISKNEFKILLEKIMVSKNLYQGALFHK